MVERLKLTLEQSEYAALLKLVLAEVRNPADQARHILRQELARCGLLVIATDAPKLNEEPNDNTNYP